MKTTYKELNDFAGAAASWLSVKENDAESKLGYALRKMFKRAQVILTDYNEKRMDILVEHAAEENKLLVKEKQENGGGYRYERDKQLACNAAIRKLFSKDAVEINPHLTDAPHDLGWSDRDAFAGFVIKGEEPAQAQDDVVDLKAAGGE